MKEINISKIKLDPVLEEIRPVNQFVVSRYRQAMRNGDQFPPLVLDKDLSLVCGYHRHAAYLAEYGEDHIAPAIVRKYKTEADRIEDAVRDNARHGMPLDGITRKRVVSKLGELGRDPESIARLLAISVKRVEELAGFTVCVRGAGKSVSRKPVKAGAQSVVGRTVRQVDYEDHVEKDLGLPPDRLAKQLLRWLRNGWIERGDKELAGILAELKEELGKSGF